MGTVHEFRAIGNGEQDEITDIEKGVLNALRDAVNASLPADALFEDSERLTLHIINEAARRLLREKLQAESDALAEPVVVDGVLYKPHEAGNVDYHSLCGPLPVRRYSHRQTGVHNGPTIVPLELRCGLIERSTPALAARVALGYAKGHMRSCEEDMVADHRVPPSRSKLERMAKAIGQEASVHARSIEVHVRRSEGLPEGTVSISMGLDRTSVPMEETLPDGVSPGGRRKKRTKHYERKKPDPVEVNYRMAYVGTITAHNEDGEALAVRRYAAGNDADPASLVAHMMADLRQWRRLDPSVHVGVVQDGAPEMWNVMRDALIAETSVEHWYEAIDRYHLNEHLGHILRLVDSNSTTRKRQLSRWNTSLDKNDKAIYSIRQQVRDYYQESVANDDTNISEGLAPHLTYLENNANLMRYASIIDASLPTGSGVTEGACKSVIEMRTNGSGQRWRPDGLASVLTLRSIYMSERLPSFWSHLARRYRADVRSAA